MEIIELGKIATHSVEAHGSTGFHLTHLAREAHVVATQLDAGGVIGRHDAVADQLLAVLSGRVIVSGADGCRHEIGPGQAALWLTGESHETLAREPVVAMLVEAEGLRNSVH